MHRYDVSRYDPPAPVALVSLRRGDGSPLIHDVPLLIDSGADITLLPRGPVLSLGVAALPGVAYQLAGFDGARSAAEAVQLDVVMLGRAFRGRYLIIDDDHGILGRDVLNSLRLILDGPAQNWSER